MKKLTLNLDALTVESFDTGTETSLRGTIGGHDSLQTCDTINPAVTCNIHCPPQTGVLGGCEYSLQCTNDPHDFQCLNSFNFCPETRQDACLSTGC